MGHPTHHLIPQVSTVQWVLRQVQTIKKIIKKCKKEKQHTPCQAQHLSKPSQLQAAITSWYVDGQAYHHIASFPHLSISHHCCPASTFGSQTVNMSNYDRLVGKSLPPRHKGHNIRVLDKASKTWIPGEVTGQSREPRSYNIRANQGSNIWRNRGHLRKLPNRTVQTLETSLAWQPRLILGQPHRKFPLPSIQSMILLLIKKMNHLCSLFNRPLEHILVGWSEPLPNIRNTQLKGLSPRARKSNKITRKLSYKLLFLHFDCTWS